MSKRTCAFPCCEKPFNCKGYCRGHDHQLKRGTPLRPLGFKAPRGVTAAQHLALRTTIVESGCWEYTGSESEDGYGVLTHHG